MRAVSVVAALLFAGCYYVPTPATGAEIGSCHPGSFGALSEHRCRRDADCLLCGEELTTRRERALSNAPCPRPSDPGRRAACCADRCVVSLGPPPL